MKKKNRKNETNSEEEEALPKQFLISFRKAKLIYLYDWKITGKWEGVYPDDSSPLTSGTFEINGLSDENDIDEVDVEICTTDTSDEGYAFKSLVRNVGVFHLRQSLRSYVEELKRDFAKDLIKPVSKTATTTKAKPEKPATAPPTATAAPMPNSRLDAASSSSGVKVENTLLCQTSGCPTTYFLPHGSNFTMCTSISLKDSFKCDVDQLFAFFTDQKLISAWSKAPVQFELVKGSSFRLFDGNVSGVVVDFIPSNNLKLQWRFTTWLEDHLSNVDISFEQGQDVSTVHLSHSGIPVKEANATTQGWKRKIFQAIKSSFGVGEYVLN